MKSLLHHVYLEYLLLNQLHIHHNILLQRQHVPHLARFQIYIQKSESHQLLHLYTHYRCMYLKNLQMT